MTRKILDNIAGRRLTIGMAHMGVTQIHRKTASGPATATTGSTGTPAALGQRG